MNGSDTELKLIEDVKAGSQTAFSHLYDKYKHILFVLCLRYAKDRSTAEDYLQDTFVKIYKNINQYDPDKGLFEFWARRIAINICLEDIRKKKLYTLSISRADNVEYKYSDALSQMSTKEMLDLIQTMPYGYKTVFNLYVIDGFSHKEIAERLGIAVGTSKSQLLKARKYLQRLIIEKAKILKSNHG